jgi:hypothetical protein
LRANRNRDGDKRAGNIVLFPVRYADDFIILVGAPHKPGQQERAHAAALAEKAALAQILKETLNLELSDAKTAITPVTSPMRFLGHHVRVQRSPGGRMWRWRDGTVVPFGMASRRVQRYRHAWMKTPDFASASMESPVHSERCTPGSERGARKPTGASR